MILHVTRKFVLNIIIYEVLMKTMCVLM